MASYVNNNELSIQGLAWKLHRCI